MGCNLFTNKADIFFLNDAPSKEFDDVNGKERCQKKTGDLKARTTCGSRML